MEPFEPKSILCGIDFSEASEVALAYTALLAHAYGARIKVLHSQHVELPTYLAEGQWIALQREVEASQAAVQAHIQEFAASHLTGAGLTAEYLAVDARPVDGLLRAVDSHRPDLVVLGSHGRGRLDRFLLGSVSSSVLREITAPLLVTRPPEKTEPSEAHITHVLCPVNYTATAAAGLQAAASLAGRLGVPLTVLHSLEDGGDRGQEHERLCAWVPEQVRADCTWEVAPVTEGPAAERIVQAAVELGADLIVIGGQHRPFLTASIMGATTERVVRHARCPVLTIPTT